MAATVPAGVSTGNARVVTYEAAGNSIQLDYCNYTMSVRQVDIGRQGIKRVYRFSFNFVMSSTTSAALRDINTNVERTLMQRAGILTIMEGGEEVFRCAPANNSIAANPAVIDKSIRRALLADVEWGPNPVSCNIHNIGVGGYGTWVVDVTVPSEDAFVIGDFLVLGVDSEVTYHIDQNHYTTRTVVGRIYGVNWGRVATNPLDRNVFSQLDQAAVRVALLAAGVVPDHTTKFMSPIRIPPNFIRTEETFHVDPTENCFHFHITDKENYRMFPTYITDADMKVAVHIKGATTAQFVRHVITGYCEAPRDVAKSRVLAACFEQIQDCISPMLTRVNSFVEQADFINHVYRNRIEYQVVVYTPYGAYNFYNSLGIGNYRSSVFLPQGVGGSAQCFGSGYRLEPNPNGRTAVEVDNGSPSAPDETPNDGVGQSETQKQKDEALAIGDRTLSFQYEIKALVDHKAKEAVPNVTTPESGSGTETFPLSRAYIDTLSQYRFWMCTAAVHVFTKDEPSSPGDYYARFLEELKTIPGLMVEESKFDVYSPKNGVLWENGAMKIGFFVTFKATGALRDSIERRGGPEVFKKVLNDEFSKGTIAGLPQAIRKFAGEE